MAWHTNKLKIAHSEVPKSGFCSYGRSVYSVCPTENYRSSSLKMCLSVFLLYPKINSPFFFLFSSFDGQATKDPVPLGKQD